MGAVVGWQMQWLLGHTHNGCCCHPTSILQQATCTCVQDIVQTVHRHCRQSRYVKDAATLTGNISIRGNQDTTGSCDSYRRHAYAIYEGETGRAYFSSLRLLVKQGADVSKAEDNAASNGLAGVPTTEQPIGVTHDPAHNTYIPQFEAPSLIAPKSLFVCHSALYTSLFLEASHSWEAQGHAGKT